MSQEIEVNLLEQIVCLEKEAADFGFQWETTQQIMAQIQSECLEVDEHLKAAGDKINRAALQEEMGDLLHAVFSLCVFCGMSPEETLANTLSKFDKRLKSVQSIAKEQGYAHLKGKTFEELMAFWNEAKRRVG